MPIRGEGLDGVADGEGNAQEGGSRETETVVYVLHPNCAVEEI